MSENIRRAFGVLLAGAIVVLVLLVTFAPEIALLIEGRSEDFCLDAGYRGWIRMDGKNYCWRYMEDEDIFMRPVDKIKQGGTQ